MMYPTGNIQEKISAPVEEAYKVLRTNIQFCGFDKRIKTITITSCGPGEGKTTTSINLAVSFAKSGMKTLLLDTDLRKPMLAKHLGGNAQVGLTTLIAGKSELGDTINSTNIENLYYMPCGPKPPNPAELIGSDKFKGFLGEVRELFDIIILDTPPLGSVIDCAIISSLTDGTILLIESSAVEYANAQRVKEQLEKANARVLGVVLNKVTRNDYRNYNYYYYYYGESGSSGKSWFKRLKRKLEKKLKTVYPGLTGGPDKLAIGR